MSTYFVVDQVNTATSISIIAGHSHLTPEFSTSLAMKLSGFIFIYNKSFCDFKRPTFWEYTKYHGVQWFYSGKWHWRIEELLAYILGYNYLNIDIFLSIIHSIDILKFFM